MEIKRCPFVLNLRRPAASAHAPTAQDKSNAVAADVPSMCVSDELYAELTSEYIVWRGAASSAGTRGFQRRAIKTPGAIALCKRNSRFLVGLLFALGYDSDPHHSVSLDLFACDRVMAAVLGVVDVRKTKGHRKYQVYLELRHLVHYSFDRAKADLSPLEQAALTLQSLAAFQAVDGAIAAACSAKKLDERKNLARSEEDLLKAGRWLSEEDRATLDREVLAYLRRAPDASVSPADAFDYQNHLIVHWLNGNSVPVFRSEVFCQLRINETIRWSEAGRHWLIEFTGENIVRTKTQQQLLCKLPASDTPFIETWLRTLRPVLNRNQDGHFFVKRDGTGPRSDIAYCARQIMRKYIERSVSPHVFRAMQATESKDAGISKQEHKAMCAGRQHAPSTCERFYERSNLKRSADQAADHLAELRNRRRKRAKLEHPCKSEPAAHQWDDDSSSSSGSSSGSGSGSGSQDVEFSSGSRVKSELIDLT